MSRRTDPVLTAHEMYILASGKPLNNPISLRELELRRMQYSWHKADQKDSKIMAVLGWAATDQAGTGIKFSATAWWVKSRAKEIEDGLYLTKAES